MAQIRQTTLARPVRCSGVGLHSGAQVTMTMAPASAGSGVVFVRTDLEGDAARIPVSPEAVSDTRRGTTVSNGHGGEVMTVEHLLSACAGLGLDNVEVRLDAPEIPILDGSAAGFVVLIECAGLKRLEAPRCHIRLKRAVVVEDGDAWAALRPGPQSEFGVEINFPGKVIGRQYYRLALDPARYRRQISPARTFGFLKDVDALRAAGLALGGSLENAIVIDGDRILNPEGLRFPDEFVRHKLLDAVGDLYVLGMPVIGRYEAVRAGHTLNNALVRALKSDPATWELAAYPDTRADELSLH